MGNELDRRTFMKGTAAAGLAFATRAAAQAPSERLGVGVIGTGGQGTHHLRKLVGNTGVKVVAVCDIYKPRLDRAKEIAGADTHHDYRDVLARDDVDCVWICTPDHWHARMAIDAMDAGKDVYCEKPMTRYWHEAKEVYEAVARSRRVVQIGSQGTSQPLWRRAREHVGTLGPLVWSQTSVARNMRDGDWQYGVDLEAGPRNLDWKRFLGPAQDRPYDPERFFRWRKYWDYSGGIATDLFVHALHALCIPLGNPWPVRVVSAGGMVVHKDRETPDSFHALIDYEGDHTVVITGTQANAQGLPVVIRGHEATMEIAGNAIEIQPERISAGRAETIEVAAVPDAVQTHHANFLDCVRRRDSRTHCDALHGYKVVLAVDMAVECWRRQRVLRFDPTRQDVR
ncbi:MAG: Gfo/Idh/MocA family oxidoreductase [Planctomycetota bacterium]|nr:Gfo/Idh/MocA family oxidoreductase [Planctomycetota bacterium]